MIYGWYYDHYQKVHNSYPPHSLIISDIFITLNSLYGIILTFIFYSCTKDAATELNNIYNNIKKNLISLLFDSNHDIDNDNDDNNTTPYLKM